MNQNKDEISLSTDWESILKEARSLQSSSTVRLVNSNITSFTNNHQNTNDQSFVVDESYMKLMEYIPSLYSCITTYIEIFHQQENINKENVRKKWILTIRQALRYALTCLSFQDTINEKNHDWIALLNKHRRIQFQNKAIENQIHFKLCQIISHSNSNTDVKCRIYAARLLCNLITSNHKNASILVNDIPLSPSQKQQKQQKQQIKDENNHDNNQIILPSWVEMISECSRCGDLGRDAIAAIVATIHNLLSAIQNKTLNSKNDKQNENDDTQFAFLLTQDKLLICNLLRHMLPVSSISSSTTKKESNTNKSCVSNTTDPMETHDDITTEWITLLLSKLFSHYGLLSFLYKSAGPELHSIKLLSLHQNDSILVTPEQVVLLHCVTHSIESFSSDKHNFDLQESLHYPLGMTIDKMENSIKFIFNETNQIQSYLMDPNTIMDPSKSYDGHYECFFTIYICFLDILSSIFSWTSTIQQTQTYSTTTQWRDNFHPQEEQLLTQTVTHLGYTIDNLMIHSKQNHGKKTRDMILSDIEKQLLPSLVRLIGNICYQNRRLQDALRTIIVPIYPNPNSHVPIMNTNDTVNDGQSQRTGLHVLLSCTSLSYACFGLREWAIVAIRHVLDNNHENQTLVEGLEVNRIETDSAPIQELNRMGIHVELDKNGNVKVNQKDRLNSS